LGAGLKAVGLGGSLGEASSSRAALAVALEGAAAAGASVELLDLRVLGLPTYSPDLEAHPPAVVRKLIETRHEADGMLWSSPMHNGSVAGSFKNAIDWLHMVGSREPPCLHDEVIGLISAAGGTQGLQVVNTMEFSVRSLRGWAAPYVVPVPQATRVFARLAAQVGVHEYVRQSFADRQLPHRPRALAHQPLGRRRRPRVAVALPHRHVPSPRVMSRSATTPLPSTSFFPCEAISKTGSVVST